MMRRGNLGLVTEGKRVLIGGDFLAATSSVHTPTATNVWHQFTGNSITLTPGSWMIHGYMTFISTGGNASYTAQIYSWATENGDNTSTNPALSTVEAGLNTSVGATETFTKNQRTWSPSSIRKTVTADEDLFLDIRLSMGTAANARITVYIYAERLS